MFAAAIFDMDGLLLDSERCLMDAWLCASREHGTPLSEADYLYTVGRDRRESHAWLRDILGSEFAAVWARVGEKIGAEGECVFPLKPGAPELLAALAARRVPCAVASSTRSREIRRRLAAVGVLDHFRAVAGADEVACGKPDPAVYQLAARRVGVAPASCIAFEDSENGARAALAAGMQVIIVPDLKTLQIAEAWAVFASLAEVTRHLPDWFAASGGERLHRV